MKRKPSFSSERSERIKNHALASAGGPPPGYGPSPIMQNRIRKNTAGNPGHGLVDHDGFPTISNQNPNILGSAIHRSVVTNRSNNLPIKSGIYNYSEGKKRGHSMIPNNQYFSGLTP